MKTTRYNLASKQAFSSGVCFIRVYEVPPTMMAVSAIQNKELVVSKKLIVNYRGGWSHFKHSLRFLAVMSIAMAISSQSVIILTIVWVKKSWMC